jgi:hypothetical protein
VSDVKGRKIEEVVVTRLFAKEAAEGKEAQQDEPAAQAP